MPRGTAGSLDALVAEFTALRAEIMQRSSVNYSIFGLQLTIGGAIFSFALSNVSRTAFLLILPIMTYALASRYVHNYLIIRDIGTYIRTVLEPRSAGGLQWEQWRLTGSSRSHPLNAVTPLFVGFPGAAIVAIGLAAPYVWTWRRSPTTNVSLILLWFIGLIVTGLSTHLIAMFARRQS